MFWLLDEARVKDTQGIMGFIEEHNATLLSLRPGHDYGIPGISPRRYPSHLVSKRKSNRADEPNDPWHWWLPWTTHPRKRDEGIIWNLENGFTDLVDEEAFEDAMKHGKAPSHRVIDIWGNIILYYHSEEPGNEHVPALIEEIKKRGYPVCTIHELSVN